MSEDKLVRQIATAIVVGFGFLVFATSLNWCAWPAAIAVRDGAAGSCFEFWLNRYQGLLSAGATLAAAAVAYLAVMHQTSRSQSSELRRKMIDLEKLNVDMLPFLTTVTQALLMPQLKAHLDGMKAAQIIVALEKHASHCRNTSEAVFVFRRVLVGIVFSSKNQPAIDVFLNSLAECTVKSQIWSSTLLHSRMVNSDDPTAPSVQADIDSLRSESFDILRSYGHAWNDAYRAIEAEFVEVRKRLRSIS